MKPEESRADLADKLTEMLKSGGVCDVGFCRPPDAPEKLPCAVSIVVPLSDAVVDEIEDAPTYTYYHHYRTVNAYIDRMLLQAGLFLQSRGYRYIPIGASQSVNVEGERLHMGRYSHKKAAVLSGLGTVGKSTLFLHRTLGPRVRLGTLFTDCPLPESERLIAPSCSGCDLCVKACPAHAIKGNTWRAGMERAELFDADACNDYMRGHFMKIGRGSVCGICMKVCRYKKG